VLVVLEVAGIGIQLRSSWKEICLDCRSYRYQRVLLRFLHTTSSKDTAYTRWFNRRVGQAHQHRLEMAGCRTTSTLFGMEWSCFYREPQTGDPDGLAAILQALEPGGLDLEYHRSLSSEDEDRRAAAGDAGRRLLRDLKERENDVPGWWEAARQFLDDPAAWRIGFDDYVEVVLPAAQ
jgi:hypothetical protein